ncbi:MAG: cyclodeaminase/cyclohydrolase family protein [Candidatus Fermentithermobacillus carboniphilus]|uniref:Cyclodeaminase/cyclohydrolase family protein n=1 Tax=Candidatus Fermentithermobacillus carboniphilus TaxID=3085328 RepID=A0AAT9LB24_9FIRM|nr:MAG: cyclodeaminase/cyclohydrolase family protein [Candidatus Fermentithermobacillus carboniphilus]
MSAIDLSTFLDALKAPSGAPGGGAASAVAGSLGCALFEMVSGITLSLPRFTEGREKLEEIRSRSQELRETFLVLAKEDEDAYRQVESAMKMPKDSPEEKASRKEAMQKAFIAATEIPLKTAENAVLALSLLPDLLQYGNPNAITDAAVGALLLDCARRGAVMNAEINMGSIRDETFRETCRKRLTEIREEAQKHLSVLKEALAKAGLNPE